MSTYSGNLLSSDFDNNAITQAMLSPLLHYISSK